MGYGQDLPCYVPLTQVAETGLNSVAVPLIQGAQYKSITEQILYEIWQTLLLILAASGGAVMTKIASFDVGDAQAGTPIDGQTSLQLPAIQGQSLVNVNLLVERNGIALQYSTALATKDIRRYNHGGNGGFVFEVSSGLKFFNGEHYDLYIVGANNTDQV